MPILERVRTTRRVRVSALVHEPAYLPERETRDYQEIVTLVKLFGLTLRTNVEDREEIPAHVAISLGAFGDAGGWRSRFAELIDHCQAHGIRPASPVFRRG